MNQHTSPPGIRLVARILTSLIALLAVVVVAAAPPSAAARAPGIPTLVGIRAAHHVGFDRLVFEFRGGLPAHRSARYVSQVRQDGSGAPLALAGDAFLHVRFYDAVGHDDRGRGTFGPTRRAFALPGLVQVATAGDFEAVLSFGVGVARRTPIKLFTLAEPDRVVIDIATPYRTVAARAYFLDSRRFAKGEEPAVRPVLRPVVAPATARGALQRLFAGPTAGEYAAGLRLVTSKATGFAGLTIKDGIARVRLTGGCAAGGSTVSIASLIMPTLKQFPSVRWVKIYDPQGRTASPTGRVDSLPACLEP
ncbi:GerMN domain-containing protein [Thermoactinospora rubra]|uniref:GerMN domain-containing protein n=1 Tax=Thermoactinospora rubra TaxID=1088767 RepID=UPI000A11095C|nr:GerMN domain-containing protein [Thermoactinospora rubra]